MSVEIPQPQSLAQAICGLESQIDEVLEERRVLLLVLKEWEAYFDNATAGRPSFGPILDRTKAAIRKAEGRQP